MGRPALSPRRKLSVYIPEEIYAELMLLRPDLQDIQGYTRYGAMSGYFTNLLRQDLEAQKQRVRAAHVAEQQDSAA